MEPLLAVDAPLQSLRQPLLPKEDAELNWEGFGKGSAKQPQTASDGQDGSLGNNAGKTTLISMCLTFVLTNFLTIFGNDLRFPGGKRALTHFIIMRTDIRLGHYNSFTLNV